MTQQKHTGSLQQQHTSEQAVGMAGCKAPAPIIIHHQQLSTLGGGSWGKAASALSCASLSCSRAVLAAALPTGPHPGCHTTSADVRDRRAADVVQAFCRLYTQSSFQPPPASHPSTNPFVNSHMKASVLQSLLGMLFI